LDVPANDISEDSLARMMGQTLYPDTLHQLVRISRDKFGWFTKHALRCIEYPWIAERCRVLGGQVLDVGAGVSPLPLFLADRCGKRVTTVDYNPVSICVESIRNHNEWGFLNYSLYDPNIQSKNIDISDFCSEQQFNVIYSVSVIEHMPAIIRRNMLKALGRVAADHCDLLFTIDLFGVSMDLWNHDRGKMVESRDVHGNLNDLISELAHEGFVLHYLEILRRAPAGKPGDLAMLHAVKRET
jgi:SAM-dependent methyltransferase